MPTISSKDFFSKGPVKVIGSDSENFKDTSSPGALEGIWNTVKNYGSGVGKQYYSATQNIWDAIQSAGKGEQTPVSASLQSAGEAAKAVFAPITQGAEMALSATGLDKPLAKAVSSISETKPVKDIIGFYKTLTPEQQKNLDAILNVGTAIIGEKGVQTAVQKSTQGVKGALGTVENVGSKISQTGLDVATGLEAKGKDILKTFAPKPKSAEDLAGMIAQGTSQDVKTVKEVLPKLDVSNIKTYKDLTSAINSKIEGVASTLDNALATDKTPRLLDSLSTKVGGTTHNYVQDALNQLENYYTKTNNIAKQQEIAGLLNKAQNEGLTVQELNNLARLHGQDLNAFNASGELASGLSKQAAENTRTGLKTTAKQTFGNKAFDAADAELTKLIKTRNLVDTVAENVTKLQQKVQERGWGEKIGRLVFQVSDKLTGGGLKGFIQSFVPRGEGLKIMNALDLEKGLQKNLKLLQDLTGKNLSESDVISKLNEIIKAPQVEKGITTKQTIKASDLGKQKMPSTIKVNDYTSKFPKYFTQDQIKSATEMLKQLGNKGKTIDMKSINSVIKKIKDMSDIKR